MREDPRCPSCDGKVSATARWCLHCGTEFDSPSDRREAGRGGTVTTSTTRDDGRGSAVSKVDDGTRHDRGRGSRVRKVPPTSRARDGRAADGDRRWDRMAERSSDPGILTGERDRVDRLPGRGLWRAVVGPAVASLDATPANRRAVGLFVPVAVWFLTGWAVEGAAATLALVGAVVLGLYVTTRSTGRTVLAASAAGSGVLVATVHTTDAVGSAPWPAVASPGTLSASAGWLALSVALVAVGGWIRTVDPAPREHDR